MARRHAQEGPMASNTLSGLLFRTLACSMVAITLLFLFNNYLNFWQGWPGLAPFLAHQGWLGLEPLQSPLEGVQITQGWIQLASYLGGVLASLGYVLAARHRPLRADADLYSALAAYIVRAAFWSVLLIGLVDMVISLLRVEGFLGSIVGEQLTKELGRPQFRGTYVHYPLMALSFLIALFVRGLGFIWLAVLVVFAEFQIVISRFVFSYEQAFMGDLVRFWYAALFLFASAYALVEEGHVRVDVFYANFSRRAKAWSNIVGSVFLGLPLCWIILTQGMWAKGSSINSPLISFEISQSGFGMYVKYLMAGFLVVFAVSMIIQFSSYFLSSIADLRDEPGGRETPAAAGH
jgi:TRAP-type mannitol/chloroaromatic compound transport system permease small subunit